MRRSALLAALAAAGCAPHQQVRVGASPAGHEPALDIVTLGDSLALGTGASSPRNGFVFRAYLRLLARRPGSRITSYAIGGATAADVLRLQVPRLAHARADAVIVCVGGNDVVHRITPATFAVTYERLVVRVRALQPHAAIVCCGVPDVARSPLFTGSDADAVARLSRADDAAVRRIARSAGAAFADLYAATTRTDVAAARYLSEDRFHPADAGYAALADALSPALDAALTRRPSGR